MMHGQQNIKFATVCFILKHDIINATGIAINLLDNVEVPRRNYDLHRTVARNTYSYEPTNV
jgi:hypothetical protein